MYKLRRHGTVGVLDARFRLTRDWRRRDKRISRREERKDGTTRSGPLLAKVSLRTGPAGASCILEQWLVAETDSGVYYSLTPEVASGLEPRSAHYLSKSHTRYTHQA